RLERAVLRDAVFERDVLGVVEVHEPETVEVEPLERLLDRALDPITGEVAGVHVAVDLGLEHETLRQAADLTDDEADALLGVAVVVARVEEVDRALEDPAYRGQGVLERDLLHVRERRVPERRAADAQRRDLQPGPAKRTKRKALSSIADHARQHMGRCVQIMRLASPLPNTFDSPEGWIALLRERAFRTAYWPL